jgi:hypothetical protein
MARINRISDFYFKPAKYSRPQHPLQRDSRKRLFVIRQPCLLAGKTMPIKCSLSFPEIGGKPNVYRH